MKIQFYKIIFYLSLIFTISLVFFAFHRYPSNYVNVIVPIRNESGLNGISEQIMVSLIIPEKVQLKEKIRIKSEIKLENEITQNQLLNPESNTGKELFNRYYLNFESRIEIPGIDINPSGKISKNLIKDKNILFSWNLEPGFDGVFEGTYWLYLNLIPKNSSDATIQEVLLARPFKIKVFSIFGFSSAWIKGIGLLMLLLNLIYGIFILKNWH